MNIDTAAVREAATAAQDGPPASRWAVLTELAMIACLESLPEFDSITFQDRRPGSDLDPILSLYLPGADEAAAWLNWFGVSWVRHKHGYCDHGRFLWRGWSVQVHGWG